jgi:hypothetical protein
MPPPEREDIFTEIKKLRRRVEQLERTIGGLTRDGIILPDTTTPSVPGSAGGAVYVEAGVLKYIAEGGTPKTVTVT